MTRRTIIAGAIAAQLLAASAASAQPATSPPLRAEPPATTTVAAATAGSGLATEYRIGTDDTLEIIVFQVPELTRTVTVDTSGEFALPLVGRVPAVGRTAAEVQDYLTKALDGKYLRSPVVTVLVKQAVSQRVTVDGAVVQPGVYNLTGPTTLLQAIALAHGPDPRLANLRKVAIFRTENGGRRPEMFDLLSIRTGKTADPLVRSNDIVVVDTSGTKSFFSIFGSSLPVLSMLRPY